MMATPPRPASTSVARAGRVFYYVSTTLALAVGALQMFHLRGGWITSYGADLFGTAWLYGLFRQGRTAAWEAGEPRAHICDRPCRLRGI